MIRVTKGDFFGGKDCETANRPQKSQIELDIVPKCESVHPMVNEVWDNGNKIFAQGHLKKPFRVLAAIHRVIEKGFSEIVLDLSECQAAFQNSMLALCAQVLRYREEGIDFHLVLPSKATLANLMRNANWAFLMDPKNYTESSFRGYKQIPATQYRDFTGQQESVNKILNVILGAVPDMQRSDFAAFEWAINEITDNVLVHSESKIGGLVQVSTFEKNRKQVEFVVADAGLGIPRTLRGGKPEIKNDIDALRFAIQEGITRDESVGQGNGLFGSYQICSRSGGRFEIESGYAHLRYTHQEGLHIQNVSVPYQGTLVIATIDFSKPNLLAEALNIGNRKPLGIDYIETQYESDQSDAVHLSLQKEIPSFGSRVSGKPLRTKLKNLLPTEGASKIIIDFSGISLISSSFADEAFAKLFLEIGPTEFMRRIEFQNIGSTVQQLIDKAIEQRIKTGKTD